MYFPHPIGDGVVGPQLDPRLNERAVQTKIDLGKSRDRCKFTLVFIAVAAKGSDVVKSPSLKADKIVASHEIGTLIDRFLWRYHCLVETRRQDVDHVDIACK